MRAEVLVVVLMVMMSCLEKNFLEMKATTFLTRLEHSLCPLQ